jgi:hypothetical protein
MRKRSAVVIPDVRQTVSPGTETPEHGSQGSVTEAMPTGNDLPVGCDVTDNVFFVKCADCGMHGSSLMHKRVGSRLNCFRCGKPFDERFTPEFIDAARERWRASQRSPVSPKRDGLDIAEDIVVKLRPSHASIATAPASIHHEECVVCGERVTITTLGRFYPCGHDGRAIEPVNVEAPPLPEPTDKGRSTSPASANAEESGESVSVTYGPELFSPRQFNNFTVGPFVVQTTVRQGETRLQAMQRASDDLRQFASIEYQRKATDFIERLTKMGELVSDRG